MAQLERPQRHDAETTMASEQRKSVANQTMEHYLRGTEFSKSSPASLSPAALSSPVGSHDAEEDHCPQPKKSVLTKVKEKAKKLKHSLSNKKKHHENENQESENTNPSSPWGVNKNDNEEEEEGAEYLGAPMYESEMAPEGYKETAKMHPRATPAVSEKHVLSRSVSPRSEQDKLNSPSADQIVAESVITKLPNETFTGIVLTKPVSSTETSTGTPTSKSHSPNKTAAETMSTNPHSPSKTVTETEATKSTFSPKKTISETVKAGYATVSEKLGTGYATVSEKLGVGYNTASEKLGTGYNAASEKLGAGYHTAQDKLGPAYATVSDATNAIASKIESLAVSAPVPSKRGSHAVSPPDPSKIEGLTVTAPTPSQSITSLDSPQALSAPAFPHKSSAGTALDSPQPSSAPAAPGKNAANDQKWDKGVSVKEYLIHKFEPGEDEKALSQVISDAMSPRKSPGEAGVMKKVTGAISSLLRNEESPRTTSHLSVTSLQPAMNTSPRIPISSNAYEVVEEDTQGRILQTN